MLSKVDLIISEIDTNVNVSFEALDPRCKDCYEGPMGTRLRTPSYAERLPVCCSTIPEHVAPAETDPAAPGALKLSQVDEYIEYARDVSDLDFVCESHKSSARGNVPQVHEEIAGLIL